MLLDSLYHPPVITVDKTGLKAPVSVHHFEGKQLIQEYIANIYGQISCA